MDYKVVLDPGHGGVDSGNTFGSVFEKDLTLEISQYIYNRLKELGIPVELTRNSDETLDRDERVMRALSFFGEKEDVLLISNHVNSGNEGKAEVIYALRDDDTLARLISNSLENAGEEVEKYYQRRLPEDTSKDYYYIHRLTKNTKPILIEYNIQDLKDNIETYGEAVVRAISQYIGGNYDVSNSVTNNVYVVQKSDSLYKIANQFGIAIDALKKANNLTSNDLSIGQYLIIPSLANTDNMTEVGNEESQNYIVYTVQKGDNLYKIATKYDVSVDEIIDLNQLPSTNLSINQQLLIPMASSLTKDLENGITYVVKSGDSLWKIANEYHISVEEIKNANNLSSNLLNIGDTLFLPMTKTTDNTYIVQDGDSLYSIAKKLNTTVDEIKRANNLSSNLLSIGKVLTIPNTTSSTLYTIQTGDSLYSIAKKFNTTVDAIKKENNLTNNLLNIGQKIKISF